VDTRRPRLAAGFFALLLNSAYLWAFADPTLWYFVQVAVHPLLGLTLAAVALWLLGARRFRPGALGRAALTILAAGLALGIAILVVGATTPYRRLVDAHVAVSAAGAALLLFYLWATASRTANPRVAWAVRSFAMIAIVAAGAAAAAHVGRDARWRAS